MANCYVDGATGDDANDGASWATPYRTIDKAIINGNGDYLNNIVYIKSGVYTITHPSNGTGVVGSLVGVGHVILRALNDSCRLGVVSGYHTHTKFFNMHFLPHSLRYTDNSNSHTDEFLFAGCGFSEGAIDVEGGDWWARFDLCRCHLENPSNLPQNVLHDSTIPNIGPFHVKAGASIKYYWDDTHRVKNVYGCNVTPQGLVYQSSNNLDNGFRIGTPSKIQTNVIDPGFVDTSTQLNGTLYQFDYNTKPSLPFYKRFDWWIQDPTTSSNGTISSDGAEENIFLDSGDNVSALSPVYLYDYGIDLHNILLTAVEFSDGGYFQGADSTPADVARTIEVRVSDTPFLQTDTSPAWVSYERDTDLAQGTLVGKYFQMRVTFNLQATL